MTPTAPASTARAMATLLRLPVSTRAMALGLTASNSRIRVDALLVRQIQIDEGDVGLRQERARLVHGAGLADDGDVRLPQQHEGQGLPEREMVVD